MKVRAADLLYYVQINKYIYKIFNQEFLKVIVALYTLTVNDP